MVSKHDPREFLHHFGIDKLPDHVKYDPQVNEDACDLLQISYIHDGTLLFSIEGAGAVLNRACRSGPCRIGDIHFFEGRDSLELPCGTHNGMRELCVLPIILEDGSELSPMECPEEERWIMRLDFPSDWDGEHLTRNMVYHSGQMSENVSSNSDHGWTVTTDEF